MTQSIEAALRPRGAVQRTSDGDGDIRSAHLVNASPITTLLRGSRGASSIMTNDPIKVIAGVDTHADTHHVALISEHGTNRADEKFVATGSGYRAIVGYITQFGPVIAVGIEGTGSYRAGLARVLAEEGFEIVEVNRTNRPSRRLCGKSDALDAYRAAESVLAGRGTSTPRTWDGYVEALRVLRTARTSAIKARTAVLTQISGILVSAPEAASQTSTSWPGNADVVVGTVAPLVG